MASGPWDNVQLQGPPNGPAWSQAAAQMLNAVGNQVGSLGDAYQSGVNFNYQQKQRNLFQNGLPTDAKGQPDRAAIIDQLIKSGGAPAAQALLPSIQQQPFRDLYLQRLQQQNNPQPTDASGGNAATPNPTTNTAVSSILGNNAPPTSPRTPYGMDGSNAPNINEIIGKSGANVPDQVAQRLATSIGVSSPEDDLTADQAKLAQVRLAAYVKRNSNGNPVPQSGGGDQEAASSNQLNPSTGEQTSAITPRQGPERRVQTAAEAPANFDNRFGASYGNPPVGAAATVPPQYRNDPNKYLQILRDRATRKNEDAQLAKLAGFDGTADEKAAEAINKQADELQKRIGEDVSRTGEQKGYLSGTTAGAEAEKGKITAGQKELDSINKMGSDARVANEKLKLPMRLVNDPGFYSGPLENLNRSYKQWTASLGGNPNAGMPQEAFKKSVNDLLSEQIRTMAASGVGRILLAEVQTMKDSIASLGTTRATDRLLLEEVNRLHNYQAGVQDLASAYLKTHTYLDQGFYSELSKFHDQHPMYTEAELRDPRLIAPPRMPAAIAREQKRGQPLTVRGQQWAKTMGLQPGDTIAGEDGNGRFKLPAFQ